MMLAKVAAYKLFPEICYARLALAVNFRTFSGIQETNSFLKRLSGKALRLRVAPGNSFAISVPITVRRAADVERQDTDTTTLGLHRERLAPGKCFTRKIVSQSTVYSFTQKYRAGLVLVLLHKTPTGGALVGACLRTVSCLTAR
jgi:hypothetical protein